MADTLEQTLRAEGARRRGAQTILGVDGERMVRERCVVILTGAGYNVLSAEDGNAALEICRDAMCPIDLALLDFEMPNMTGSELLNRLASAQLAVRFIIMSGYWENACVNLGVANQRRYSFLRKPFTPSALLHAVSRELEACIDGKPASAEKRNHRRVA